MFSRFLNKYRAWRLAAKLEQYEDQLASIDGSNIRPEQYALRLKEFWRGFDTSLLKGVTVRDLMGNMAQFRIPTFILLHELMLEANNAIATEKDSLLDYTIRTQVAGQREVELSQYFHSATDGYLSVETCAEHLRLLLIAHCGILENIEGTYAQRKMLHVYYDIEQLTETILDVIAEKESNNLL